MMPARRAWRDLARVAVSILALWLLLREVGGSDLTSTLGRTDLGLLFSAWLLFLAGILVRVFRWRALLRGLGLCPPFCALLRLYLIGSFFNAFLPSGFGGDVIRVLELGRDAVDRTSALGTVLVDRLTGILSLMALGLLMLPVAEGMPRWLAWLLVGVAGCGLLAGGLLLQGTLLRRVTSSLPGWMSLSGEGKLARIYAAVAGCGSRAIALALVYSTLFNLLNIAVHWLCARAVGIDLQLSFYFILVPLLSLTLLVPLSVGGLGARDWVAQILLAPTAVPEASVAAWTLSIWAVTAAAGLIGGVLYLGQGVIGVARRHS